LAAEDRARRNTLADLTEAALVWLFLERDNLAVPVEPEDAHTGGFVQPHRLCGDRHVSLLIDVRLDHLGVIHAVEMVPGENQVVVGVVPGEMTPGLSDGVGRPLEPVRIVGCLLGRQNLHESLAEGIHAVGLRDVPVQ
jgi:hypothetical protein